MSKPLHTATGRRDEPGPGGSMPPELDPRHLVRRLVLLALLVAAVVAAVSAIPGLGDVRQRLAHVGAGWLGAALVLKLASMLAFVAVFRAVYCHRLAWRLSAQVALAELAANVLVPTGGVGGLALGAWALQRGGMPTAHIARRTVAFFLITSSVNFAAVILAGTLLALGIAGSTSLALALVPAALAATIVLAVIWLPRLLPDRRSHAHNRLLRRLGAASAALSDGIRDAVALVRSGQLLLLAGAVGYMAFDAATLAAAFHALGGAPAIGTLVLAYTVGQLGGLIPLPGGIGGTDGGLIAAFVLYGSPLAAATAAVLAYRAFQLGLPALTGTIAFAQLQRTLARSPTPAALCEPMAAAYQTPAA